MAVRWRTPTVVILAGCLIGLVSFGLRSSFGLFTEPLSAVRGFDRETFAFAIAIQNLVWGLGQPVAGAIADRYGSGRVLACGGLLYVLGTVLMAESTTGAQLALTAGVLIGLGLAGGSFMIVLAAFARLVPEERRSWAMGLATAAGSLGQFVFAPLGQAFIAGYGAVTALVLLSGFVALVPLLAIALSGQGEDGASEPEVSTRLPPYLGDLGFSPSLAAWSVALIGLFNVIGAYTAGVLGGRMSRRLLLSGIYFSRAIAFALFVVLPTSALSVLLFGAAIGLLWLSTVPLTSGLVALMFGTRHAGMLFGFVFLSHQVGAFAGVWLGGAIYEATGAYDAMWWISIALGLGAAIVHLPIHERRAPRWE